MGKLPNYLMSLFKLKSICHNTRSQSLISLEIPLTKTNIDKIAFKLFASHKWNTVQVELKLTKYLSVNQFKSLLDAKDVPQCCCFKWFSDLIFLLYVILFIFLYLISELFNVFFFNVFCLFCFVMVCLFIVVCIMYPQSGHCCKRALCSVNSPWINNNDDDICIFL